MRKQTMSEQRENRTDQQNVDAEDDDIHLLDLLIVLARHKKLVVFMPLIAGLVAVVASMMMAPVFTSSTKIIPPQQQSSTAAAMLGQLSGLAGMAGGIAGLKSPGDMYVSLLESRTVADRLISRFNLQERFKSENMDDVRAALAGARQINSDRKDGLISITVKDEDPKFAAELANAYVDELIKLTQTMAISEASQRRLFFEIQLKETKGLLENAEIALRTTQEKTGMIQPEGQVQAIISAIAQLRGTIAAKEVELNAMRTFATPQNPELLRTQQELRGLQAQLAKLEKNRAGTDADFMVPTGRIPQVGVEYVRAVRDVKYFETIFELLAKQYELAKIDEAKEASVIQVLDRAVPAERRTAPKRSMIVVVGILLGGFLGILLAFFLEFIQTSRQREETRARWEALSLALKSK